MTWIRVEPEEMTTTAATLHRTAGELSGELTTRGATAATDSLSVAAISAAPEIPLVGGSTFSSSISSPGSTSSGPLVGGNTWASPTVQSSPSSGGALVGGPFRWRGPSPSELWAPIVSGNGGTSGPVLLGPIDDPFTAPTPWALKDGDLDGIPNGQDRNPNLDDRTDTDRSGIPDAFDRRDNDPTVG